MNFKKELSKIMMKASMKEDKKGIAALLTYAILVVAAVVVIGFGGQFLSQIQSTQTAASVAYNVTGFGLTGLATMGSYIPIIVGLLVLAVVLGIFYSLGLFGGGRSGGSSY